MKNQKGITLTSLIIYVIGLTIIAGIVFVITNFFYQNIVKMEDAASSAAEYSKFNVAFIKEIKKTGVEITEIAEDHVTFNSGNTYMFKNGKIYLNKIAIANEIQKCKFESYNYEKKTIVSVDVEIGDKNGFEQKIEYTLAYE